MMCKAQKVAFSLFISLLALSFSACAVNITKPVKEELKSPELYQERRYQPVDMKTASKCALPPSINISNAETGEKIIVMESVRKFNVNPKELTDGIIEYMKDAFGRCGVKSDPASKKVVSVSLGETIVESPVLTGGHNSMVHLLIDIPEIKFNRYYQGEDTTTHSRERALALAVQRAVWKVIGDAEIQGYFLCNSVKPITQ